MEVYPSKLIDQFMRLIEGAVILIMQFRTHQILLLQSKSKKCLQVKPNFHLKLTEKRSTKLRARKRQIACYKKHHLSNNNKIPIIKMHRFRMVIPQLHILPRKIQFHRRIRVRRTKRLEFMGRIRLCSLEMMFWRQLCKRTQVLISKTSKEWLAKIIKSLQNKRKIDIKQWLKTSSKRRKS